MLPSPVQAGQQIGARIAYNEMDMVLFFVDPNDSSMEKE